MNPETIKVIQGHSHTPTGTINVVIDVFRAFTVEHILFEKGAEKIYMVNDIDRALELKKELNAISIGEIGGIKIPEFDYGNSPSVIDTVEVTSLVVHKTSNGVKAAINAKNADHVFVTGFANARVTAEYILNHYKNSERVNIIASHPSDQDDIVCAEYIKDVLVGNSFDALATEEALKRCSNTEKFRDPEKTDFPFADIDYCSKERNSNFVMKVAYEGEDVTVKKVTIA